MACQERSNDVSWKIIQENDNRVSYGIIVNCLTFNSECLCLVFMSISCLWASHLSLSSGLLQTEQQQRNYLGFQASYSTAITLTLQKTGNKTILEHAGIGSFLIEHNKAKTQVITNLAYKNIRDKSQEKANSKDVIGFSFVSDGLWRWCKFSNQITSFSKEKPKQTWITSNTQTKTALLDKEKSNKLCQMIACFTSAML